MVYMTNFKVHFGGNRLALRSKLTFSQLKSYETSFETVGEFLVDHVIIGQNSVSQGISTEQVVDGTYSHKAETTGTTFATNNGGQPHRAYPALKLYNSPGIM